jgi:predicted anti-sigma-YlaC factor YlaD
MAELSGSAVTCDAARELVSARLDGELASFAAIERDAAEVADHLQACPDCARFADRSAALVRRTRIATAWPVPDLTDRVLAAVAEAGGSSPRPEPRRVRDLRLVVALAGFVQLALAVPALLGMVGTDLHLGREVGALQLALGVGLILAARQPHRATGVLPIAAVVAAATLVTAVVDAAAGVASLAGELVHLAELIGVVALWALARRYRASGTPSGAPTPPDTVDASVDRVVGAR